MSGKFILSIATAIGLATVSSTPAHAAATLCSVGGFSNLSSGCRALGNDNEAATEGAINAALGLALPGIDLTPFGKSDDATGFAKFNFFNGSSPVSNMTALHTLLNGSWQVKNGTLIQYLTVKAGSEFLVFQLAGSGQSSGTFSSFGIEVGKKLNQPAVSHLTFWTTPVPTTAVPEPATWAMMIAGFGIVGGAMRRRAKVTFQTA